MLVSLLSTAAIASPSHPQIAAATWSAVTTAKHAETGPIQVEKTRIVDTDCFRGVTQVTGLPPGVLLDTAIDVVGAVEWSSADLTQGKVLSRVGDRMTYFQYLNVPNWTLASDRFWFLEGEIQRDGAGLHFRWDRLTQDVPLRREILEAHPGAVEPPVNVGSWSFLEGTDGVKVTYVICSDTGGSMPRMLQNAATRKALPNTMGDVVRQARRVTSQ